MDAIPKTKDTQSESASGFSAHLAAGAATAGTFGLVRIVNAHTTTQAQHQVESALLLDVVVGESAAVLELLAGEDEALLVRGDAFLVLDLGLDGVDGVGGLDFEGDGLAGQSLDEHLHSVS